jgi:pimeloyl-ACP methyl ester carboxylesterase
MMKHLDLHTLTWGSGDKRALLVHGLSSNAAGWWRLGPDLADLGYTVTAPDLRSHGESPKSEDLSVPAYAADVLALGSQWDLVLGHSLGGAVVLACLETDPDFAKKLILEDPAKVIERNPLIRTWLLDVFNRPLTTEQISLDNPRWQIEDARAKAEALRQSGPEVVDQTLNAEAWDGTPVLAGISVPTLLLGADPTLVALVTPEIGQAFAASNPLIEFETIVNGSHSMHRDEYRLFWDRIRDWLAATSAAEDATSVAT